MIEGLTAKQRELMAKHGHPGEFAVAVYKAVPSFISMDEAEESIRKYNREWAEAGEKVDSSHQADVPNG